MLRSLVTSYQELSFTFQFSFSILERFHLVLLPPRRIRLSPGLFREFNDLDKFFGLRTLSFCVAIEERK